MLKVQINDPKSGFRMNMPVPYHLFIDMVVRKSTARLFLNHHDSSGRQRQEYLQALIEAVDFDALRRALHQLKGYKGLTLVDVEAADGTIVKIFSK